MKIFGGSSNRPLVEKIASELGTSLSPLEIHIFPDGERRVRVLDKVLGERCVVIQSCSTPADTNYMELFFIVDALKRAGAKSIISVIPYLGYQRQDHLFREGESVSLEVIIETLEAVGMDKLIVVDLHSIKIPELFHIPIIHLSALEVFAQKIKEEKWNNQKSILVSPDMGGIRRVKILSTLLSGMPYATIEKNRDLSTGEVTAENIEGLKNVKKGTIERSFIVDDLISSGATIATASNLLRSKGIREIFVFATHPVFSNEAPKILQEALVERVFVTDTINIPQEKHFSKLEILSISQMISKKLISS